MEHAEAPPSARVAAIVNPATRIPIKTVQRLLTELRPPGVRLEIVESRRAGDARALAQAAAGWADLVLAVGGDGTVAEVVSGVLGRDVAVGIVPAGSTNVVARDIGLPTSLSAAASLAFRSRQRVRRDVGICGERCFLHMAGAGFDSHFFERTDRELKKRIGWLAYLPAAAEALQVPPARFTIVADDETVSIDSALVLVANGGAVINPGWQLQPGILPDDGWLDLLVFTATTPGAIGMTFALMATGKLANSPLLWSRRARRIELHADPPLAVELDGDVVQQTPAVFEIVPRGIEVVAPDGQQRGWLPFLPPGRQRPTETSSTILELATPNLSV